MATNPATMHKTIAEARKAKIAKLRFNPASFISASPVPIMFATKRAMAGSADFLSHAR